VTVASQGSPEFVANGVVVHNCVNRKFLGMDPFPMQMFLMLELFEDYCVAADTLVCTADGIKQIDALGPSTTGCGLQPRCVSLVTRDGVETTSRHGLTKRRAKVVELELERGLTLRATPTHRVLTANDNGEGEWRQLDRLNTNDYVAVKLGADLWAKRSAPLDGFSYAQSKYRSAREYPTPRKCTPELARVLGYLVAEGHVSTHEATFTNSDERLLDDYLRCVRACFGDVPVYVDVDQRKGKTKAGTLYQRATNLRIASRYVLAYLRYAGLGPSLSHTKEVPWSVLQSPKTLVLEFLRAYAEGDGSASSGCTHSASRKLTQQLVTILLNLGVLPAVRRLQPRTGRPQWMVDLRGPAERSYIEKVSCFAGMGRADQYAARPDVAEGTQYKRGLVWLRVRSVRAAGTADVYDVTVPGSQSFVADGVVVHNCPWCSDMEWWRNQLQVDTPLTEFRSHLQLYRHGKCRKCGRTRLDAVKEHKWFFRDELAACLGQRAGKTACIGFISTYHLHRFLTREAPWQTYGVLANQKMLMTFVALTEKQVVESLWDSFIGKVGISPWFDKYHKFLRDEGKRLGEELFSWKTTFITYFHKRLMAHYAVADERTLRGPTRFFACVTGDTLVPTERGLLRADALHAGHAQQVVTETGTWGAVTKRFTQVAPVIRLRTQHGFELGGSPEHPVRVLRLNGRLTYKRLEEVTRRDVVVLRRGFTFATTPPELPEVAVPASNNQRYHVPRVMSRELARLLGYLAAEGGTSSTNMAKNHEQVTLYTADAEIADDYRQCFAKVFGRAPIQERGRPWRFATQSNIVVRFLRALGADGDSHTKQVPWPILQAPREYVVEFLRGYFDGDSTLDDNRCLTAESASFVLHQQIQLLLLGIGIVAHRRTTQHHVTIKQADASYAKEWRTYSMLRISGRALNRYGQQIGSILPRKRVRSVPRDDRDVIPVMVSAFRQLPASYLSRVRTARGVARAMLRAGDYVGRALDAVAPATMRRVRKLAHRHLVYDRVVAITTDTLEQPVYDITVLPQHNFVANGLVVSNSVDEVGWFDAKNYNKKVKGNARGVIASLANSLMTVRGAAEKRRFRGDYDLPTAIMCNIGSPSSMDDEIMRLVRMASKHVKIFALHAPTWDINPELSPDACRRAADEDGGLDFDRDFGAIPPLASDPFIDNKTKLDMIFSHGDPPLLHLEPQEKLLTLYGQPETFVWYKVTNTMPERTIPRMVAVDTGETFNSFGLTIAHWDIENNRIVVDQVIEINPAGGRRVFFPGVLNDMLLWMADNLRVRLFAFDRWQCLAAGTRINTNRGLIPIEEVVEGDMVHSRVGPRPVKKRWSFGKRPTLRLITEDGDVLEGTHKHRIEVATSWQYDSVTTRLRRPVWGWRRLDQLRVGDVVHMVDDAVSVDAPDAALTGDKQQLGFRKTGSVGKIAEWEFPKTMTPALAEWLGLIWGDGTIQRDGVSLTVADHEARDAARVFERLFGVPFAYLPRGDHHGVVQVSGRWLVRWLKENGLTKPLIPEAVLRSSRKVKAAFVKGLFATDGNVKKDDGGVSFYTKHRVLADQVRVLLRTDFGLESQLVVLERKPGDYVQTGLHYVVSVRGSRRRFLEQVSFSYQRKQSELRRHADVCGRHAYTRVALIEDSQADVYDLMVEDDPSYIANGFISHNSTDFVHTLADHKQDAVVHSLKYAEMVNVRAALLSDQVLLPSTDFRLASIQGATVDKAVLANPISHLKLQLGTIRNLGHRVVKPAKGTDDLWRTLALAVHHILGLKSDFAAYVTGLAGPARRSMALYAVRKGTLGGTGGFRGSTASYYSKKAHGVRGLVTVKKGAGGMASTPSGQRGRGLGPQATTAQPSTGASVRKR
jgi:intein/homing endonuclease